MARSIAHHKIGWLVVAAAAAMTCLDGLWFSIIQHIPLWHGIYCIWMTAITVGGDVQPVHQGYLALALAPVPLLAAALSYFTSALANIHIRRSQKAITEHVTVTCDPEQAA